MSGQVGQRRGDLGIATINGVEIAISSGGRGVAKPFIVDHPGQPVDYIHPFPDGPVWTWHQEWRVVGGARLRVYDLMVSIVLRGGIGLADDLIVDHPRQPADYTHADGTVWRWHKRWRLADDFQDDEGTFGRFHTHLRVYDLVTSDADS